MGIGSPLAMIDCACKATLQPRRPPSTLVPWRYDSIFDSVGDLRAGGARASRCHATRPPSRQGRSSGTRNDSQPPMQRRPSEGRLLGDHAERLSAMKLLGVSSADHSRAKARETFSVRTAPLASTPALPTSVRCFHRKRERRTASRCEPSGIRVFERTEASAHRYCTRTSS